MSMMMKIRSMLRILDKSFEGLHDNKVVYPATSLPKLPLEC